MCCCIATVSEAEPAGRQLMERFCASSTSGRRFRFLGEPADTRPPSPPLPPTPLQRGVLGGGSGGPQEHECGALSPPWSSHSTGATPEERAARGGGELARRGGAVAGGVSEAGQRFCLRG